jgi:hypothetical protein
MTVEKADFPPSLSLERMAPVATPSAVQGQSSPEDEQGKPRRRPPPKASAEPSEEASEKAGEDLNEDLNEDPQHRIDDLA